MIIQKLSDGTFRKKPLEDKPPQMKVTSGSGSYKLPVEKKIKWSTKKTDSGDINELSVYVGSKYIGRTDKNPKNFVRSYLKKLPGASEVKV